MPVGTTLLLLAGKSVLGSAAGAVVKKGYYHLEEILKSPESVRKELFEELEKAEGLWTHAQIKFANIHYLNDRKPNCKCAKPYNWEEVGEDFDKPYDQERENEEVPEDCDHLLERRSFSRDLEEVSLEISMVMGAIDQLAATYSDYPDFDPIPARSRSVKSCVTDLERHVRQLSKLQLEICRSLEELEY